MSPSSVPGTGLRTAPGLQRWLPSGRATARAESLAQESLALWGEIGNRWFVAFALHTR